MKYGFSAKTWFVKTSTRIVKYDTQFVKSNPGWKRIWDESKVMDKSDNSYITLEITNKSILSNLLIMLFSFKTQTEKQGSSAYNMPTT